MDTDCFYILAIVNNAAMNIEVHVSFQSVVLVFFQYIPRSALKTFCLSLLSVFMQAWHISQLYIPNDFNASKKKSFYFLNY